MPSSLGQGERLRIVRLCRSRRRAGRLRGDLAEEAEGPASWPALPSFGGKTRALAQSAAPRLPPASKCASPRYARRAQWSVAIHSDRRREPGLLEQRDGVGGTARCSAYACAQAPTRESSRASRPELAADVDAALEPDCVCVRSPCERRGAEPQRCNGHDDLVGWSSRLGDLDRLVPACRCLGELAKFGQARGEPGSGTTDGGRSPAEPLADRSRCNASRRVGEVDWPADTRRGSGASGRDRRGDDLGAASPRRLGSSLLARRERQVVFGRRSRSEWRMMTRRPDRAGARRRSPRRALRPREDARCIARELAERMQRVRRSNRRSMACSRRRATLGQMLERRQCLFEACRPPHGSAERASALSPACRR